MRKIAIIVLSVLLLVFCGAGIVPEDEFTSGQQPEDLAETAPAQGSVDTGPLMGQAGSPEAMQASLDLTGGVITGFGYERAFAALKPEVYTKGELDELYSLQELLMDLLDCTILLPGGESVVGACTATWNTSELPLDIVGHYNLIATLIPPIGCTFGEGVRTQIVLPVQIIDDKAPVDIVSIEEWSPYALAVAAEQGSTVSDIQNIPILKEYTTAALRGEDENGGLHDVDIRWDFSSLPVDVLGVHTIAGTLIPPEGTAFAEGLALPKPTATISVQAKGKPDINCFYLLHPDMLFPWLAPPGNLGAVRIWLSEEEGAWQELDTDKQAGIEPDKIRVATRLFTKGKSYRIQVDYEGGQTGIFSFLWDNTIVIKGYWGGDRDGGDSNGNKPPATVPSTPLPDEEMHTPTPPLLPEPEADPSQLPPPEQAITLEPSPVGGASANDANHPTNLPAQNERVPQGPSKPAHEAGFQEEWGQTYSILSGTRLLMMIDNGGELHFSKQGVTIILSKEAVAALGITDDMKLYVEIQKTNDNAFKFSILINDNLVPLLTATKVRLPYAANGGSPTLLLQNAQKETVATGQYEATQGIALFVVNTGGQYTIIEQSVSAAPFHTNPELSLPSPSLRFPIVVIITGALVLFYAGMLLWKRRASS